MTCRVLIRIFVSAAISRLPSNVVNGSTEIHSLRFGFGYFVVLSISTDQLRGRASIYFVVTAILGDTWIRLMWRFEQEMQM